MVRNLFIGVSLVFDVEVEWIEGDSSSESNEVQILTVLFFLVYPSAYHESTSEEGGSVMF